MRKAWPIVLFLLLSQSGLARAEALGLGAGLMAYPLDLRGLKAELAASGASPGGLAGVPDFAPLPHLLLRGRLGLPIVSWAQLEVGRLALSLPLDPGTGTTLGLDSTTISFGFLGELKALFLGLALGLGTDLIQGRLRLNSTNLEVARFLEDHGLESRAWSVAAIHGSGELELGLGPLRLYLQGKYLYPLSQTGLGLGVGIGPWAWEAGLGLMLVI